MERWFWLYLLAANLAAFALMGVDKGRARRGPCSCPPSWAGPWGASWA